MINSQSLLCPSARQLPARLSRTRATYCSLPPIRSWLPFWLTWALAILPPRIGAHFGLITHTTAAYVVALRQLSPLLAAIVLLPCEKRNLSLAMISLSSRSSGLLLGNQQLYPVGVAGQLTTASPRGL